MKKAFDELIKELGDSPFIQHVEWNISTEDPSLSANFTTVPTNEDTAKKLYKYIEEYYNVIVVSLDGKSNFAFSEIQYFGKQIKIPGAPNYNDIEFNFQIQEKDYVGEQQTNPRKYKGILRDG